MNRAFGIKIERAGGAFDVKFSIKSFRCSNTDGVSCFTKVLNIYAPIFFQYKHLKTNINVNNPCILFRHYHNHKKLFLKLQDCYFTYDN